MDLWRGKTGILLDIDDVSEKIREKDATIKVVLQSESSTVL